MSTEFSKPIYAATLALFAVLAALSPAWADINDYEFQLVETEFRKGRAIVAVRLVHKPDHKLVPDAVIFAKRLDMAPDDMESMTSMIERAPSSEPGVYRFKIDLTAAGGWRMSLAAKIQGETGALVSRLTLKALP